MCGTPGCVLILNAMEFTPKKIPVDPMDPKDIAKHLPALEREAARTRAFAEQAAELAKRAENSVRHLRALAELEDHETKNGRKGTPRIKKAFVPAAPQTRANGKDAKRGSSREAILQLLDDEGKPMALRAMRDALADDFAYDTLRGMVKDMTKDGDLVRVSQGVYAPSERSYERFPLLTITAEGAAGGAEE